MYIIMCVIIMCIIMGVINVCLFKYFDFIFL